MATLIQNELRVKACEDINNMLNEVQTINTAILDGEKTQFSISWGRRRSISVRSISTPSRVAAETQTTGVIIP